MNVRAGRIFATVLFLLGWQLAASALASGSVGPDPSSNFPIGSLPAACATDPTGATCIDASVSYLDQARASLGQPAYSLPADFASLTPAEQALILTDSDRTLYNLPPITGVTDELDQDAAAALASDSDPRPSTSSWYGYTANAAWGNTNIVLAYESWMYDDGPGSDNVDCTASDPSGCWGHRHDILWQFGPGALAMGAAAGTDSGGNPSYAMLLVQGSPDFAPVYTYTWAQAEADGAGGASAPASPPASSAAQAGDQPARVPVAVGARAGLSIETLRIRGHQLTLWLAGSAVGTVRCSLSGAGGRVHRSKACGARVTFRHLPSGHYRLHVSSTAGALTRRVAVP